MLTTNDITVVLYFFLFLFKFLLAITPPIPNIFFVSFDVFNFFAFIFISAFPRIASIGGIFDALLAGIMQDKYIVIPDMITDMIIGSAGTLYTNFDPFSISPKSKFTIQSSTMIAIIPHTIPKGIAITPM